jgi:hypothetical protein
VKNVIGLLLHNNTDIKEVPKALQYKNRERNGVTLRQMRLITLDVEHFFPRDNKLRSCICCGYNCYFYGTIAVIDYAMTTPIQHNNTLRFLSVVVFTASLTDILPLID